MSDQRSDEAPGAAPARATGESVTSRVLRILEAFEAGPSPLTLTQIAESAGLPLPTAYRLTDRQGNQAYVWWEAAGKVVVDAGDPGFRRRVQRALKKPIWTVEDERDEHGFTLTTHVLMQPDDPRYASRLFWRWDQLGIRGLEEVEVVRRSDRQPVRTLLSLMNEHRD